MTGGTLEDASVVYLTGADGAQPKRMFDDHDRMSEFNVAKSADASRGRAPTTGTSKASSRIR